MIEVSKEANQLLQSADVVDLHLDSYIWRRIFRYRLTKKHGRGLFRGMFYSQSDLPRLTEAGFKGGIWSVTTNPLRSSERKPEVLLRNVRRLVNELEQDPAKAVLVRSHGEYVSARLKNQHAVFLGVQGGDPVFYAMPVLGSVASHLIKVTVVHLSRSVLGDTSSPLGKGAGLSVQGKEFIRFLNSEKIFVDLAHISRAGFFDAMAVHDRMQPAIVSHTGVNGVYSHWRNLDDEQIRAIAKTGGVVGIMYQTTFLGPQAFVEESEAVIDHLEHVIAVGGEDLPALGSDWDGMIIPPGELRDCRGISFLVERMLRRAWTPERIQKVLGGNYLRALKQLRG